MYLRGTLKKYREIKGMYLRGTLKRYREIKGMYLWSVMKTKVCTSEVYGDNKVCT